MNKDQFVKKAEKLIARHNVMLLEDDSYMLNSDELAEALYQLHLEGVREERQDEKERIAEEYGDFKGKDNRTLRFYLLPHFKHLPGDNGETQAGQDYKLLKSLREKLKK